ncbi:hypothetical protein BDN72DRAFT_960372 [Pluteus cervinus]|uniref:Uncharacterized protein n=1 Tax=Pluteus cervinus TaxID=181527 RepID=A0ACD3AQS7_9AGAR|nr:hypothetical protein BDN72DRAFT_960372 [Pluteus cervinus]
MANEPQVFPSPKSPTPPPGGWSTSAAPPRKRKRPSKRSSARGTPVTTPRASTPSPDGDHNDSDNLAVDPGPSTSRQDASGSSRPSASKKRSKTSSRNGGSSAQSQPQPQSQTHLPSQSQPQPPPPQPSSLPPPPPNSPPPLPPSSSQNKTQPPKTSFEDNDDFIAFNFSSDDEVLDVTGLARKGQRNRVSDGLTGKEIAMAKIAAGTARRVEKMEREAAEKEARDKERPEVAVVDLPEDTKPTDGEAKDKKERKREKRRERDRSRDSRRDEDSDRDRDHSRRHSRKGKERETERDVEHDDRDSRRRSRRRGDDDDPPAAEREWDRGKPRDRDRRDRDRDRDRKRKRERSPRSDAEEAYFSQGRWVDLNTRKTPWVRQVDWEKCKNAAEMLHHEVEAFVKWISPSPVEDEIRGLIVQTISRAVESAFPDATVLPFGSYETKLYLPLGDIDLVILSNSMAYSNKTNVLHSLAQTIKRSGISDRVTIIAKAKVPIIKFITTHGRFNVDISINQDNGLRSGQIINGFLQDMRIRDDVTRTPQESGQDQHTQRPKNDKKANGRGKPIPTAPSSNPNNTNIEGSLALRSLVLITKAFLSQRQMNEVFTGGLGSYSIVCLAVSFLQMHPKIRRGEIDAEKNLGVLVMEFFELYGCYFNYEEVGISLREGGTYFSKRKRGWFSEGGRGGGGGSGLLTIEDPADPSNDISKGSYAFPKVRTTFAGAYNILTATAYLRAGVINSRRNDRSVRLRNGGSRPEDFSILSSVLNITQETINHRKLVQELYDQRILHSILGVAPRPRPSSVEVEVDGDRTPRAGPSKSTSHAGAQSVESAWREADNDAGAVEDGIVLEDGARSRRKHGESSPKPKSKSKSTRGHQQDADKRDKDEDEEGRYGISREPHKKKRKTESRRGHRGAVFTTDDDSIPDSEPGRLGTRSGAVPAAGPASGAGKSLELRIHARVDSGSVYMEMSDDAKADVKEEGEYVGGGEEEEEKRNKRRSYWLSKGLGRGDGDEYESG